MKGYTLIELLLASAILSSLLVVGASAFATSTRVNNKINLTREVSQSVRIPVEVIVRDVQNSSDLALIDSTGAVLTLTLADGLISGQNLALKLDNQFVYYFFCSNSPSDRFLARRVSPSHSFSSNLCSDPQTDRMTPKTVVVNNTLTKPVFKAWYPPRLRVFGSTGGPPFDRASFGSQPSVKLDLLVSDPSADPAATQDQKASIELKTTTVPRNIEKYNQP